MKLLQDPIEARVEHWQLTHQEEAGTLFEAIQKHLPTCAAYQDARAYFLRLRGEKELGEWEQQIPLILQHHAVQDILEYQMPVFIYGKDGLYRRIHDILTNLSYEEEA